jgi:hypothetical protein
MAVPWRRDEVVPNIKCKRPMNCKRQLCLELREALVALERRDANDTKTASAWRKMPDAAPKVWEGDRAGLQS